MFLGEFNSVIEEDNRIVVPPPILKKLGRYGDRVVIIEGIGKYLCLFSLKDWDAALKSFKKIPSPTIIKIKTTGRISISDDLKKRAGLERHIVFVGCNQYVEIWDQQGWTIEKGKGIKDRLAAFNRI